MAAAMTGSLKPGNILPTCPLALNMTNHMIIRSLSTQTLLKIPK